jgi:putative transposase
LKKATFSEEQIARILQEGATGQTTQSELCRKHGISEATYYTWKRKYGGMETEDVRRLKELERENAQLKRLLAERDLEVDAAKQLLRKNGQALPPLLKNGGRERTS